jgi:hypothetical protein
MARTLVEAAASRDRDYRVVRNNPPEAFLTIRSDDGSQGFTIANKEVFDHLYPEYTLAHLDALIPSRPGEWVFLGVLFDIEISLDHHGKFHFGKSPFEEIEDEKCEHGFVVRDIQGDNRFLCRECDARFPRHPSLLATVEFEVDGLEIANTLVDFRKGLVTFTEATKRTNLTLDAFKEGMEKISRPLLNVQFNTSSLGGTQPIGRVTSVEPQRTSCPKEIEEYFANIDSTCLTPGSIGFPFDDVVEVSGQEDFVTSNINIEVTFVDGTKQKVVRLLPSLSRLLPHRPPFDYSGEC